MFRSLIYLLLASSMILLASCAKLNGEGASRNPAVDENGTCDAYLSQSDVCIDLIWDTKSSNGPKRSFYLEFYNPDDRSQFIDLKNDLEVSLWMPSTGESSLGKVEKMNPGQYYVSDVYFARPGTWEIQFKLKKGTAVVEQTALSYRY